VVVLQGAVVVQLEDVEVLQAGDGSRLALEAQDVLRAFHRIDAHHLDRYRAADLILLLGQVDDRRPAPADLPDQLVAADVCAFESVHHDWVPALGRSRCRSAPVFLII